MQEQDISIDREGRITFIWNDDFAELLDEGVPDVRRASHVEPTSDGQWEADMAPMGGPVLGPFKLRGDALRAETDWLKEHLFGEES